MKKYRIVAILLLAVFVGLFVMKNFIPSGNSETKKSQSGRNDAPRTEVTAPLFDADSAFAFVKAQVDFGPRVPNTPAHVKCGDWLVTKLKSYGATVIEQKAIVNAFDGTPLNMRNIIASFHPSAKRRVMLAAHWDSRPFGDKDPDKTKWKKPIDGANDGASGVAVLLELARQMNALPENIGVDIALWDAEDYGRPEFDATDDPESYKTWCLGSQYWEMHPHVANYQASFGILLDMVGAKDARFNREGFSAEAAPDVQNRLWTTAQKLGYSQLFLDPITGDIVDDHLFMNRAGVRTVDIIDMRPTTKAMGFNGYEFGGFHHTHQDNIDIIDPQTLKAVGHTVSQVIYNL